jgi:hypothetical protein
MFAHQRRFLTEMGIVAGNPGAPGCFAYAGFTGKPVNAAFTRAKATGAEKMVCGFYLFMQQPALEGFDICGFKMLHSENIILAYQLIYFKPRKHEI